MAEDQQHHLLPPPLPPSGLGVRHQQAMAVGGGCGGCGEIVEVQGGHIVRSTGRKDRHSKVCTAKGPRDRRVRLSAPTAIQFYDVQDRLGFDRPSKAVDWLIKKAKSAIDELAELPPWNPAETLRQAATNAKPRRTKNPPPPPHEDPHGQFTVEFGGSFVSARGSGGPPAEAAIVVGLGGAQQQRHIGEDQNNQNEFSFLPPSLDSDSIADTIKSFFPIGGACASTGAPPQLVQSYHPSPPPDLLSRTSCQNQDLRLSLQSLHDPPPLILHNLHNHHHHSAAAVVEPVLFARQNIPLGFDMTTAAGWEQSHSHNHHHQSLQRSVAWNSGGAVDTGGGGGGFVFASPSTTTPSFQPVFGQSQMFSQRGPLQSINTPMIHAWFDPHHHLHRHHHHQVTGAADDLHHHHPYHQSANYGAGFASQTGEFLGFHIPARIQGEGEEHDGVSNKPSSVSSISRH